VIVGRHDKFKPPLAQRLSNSAGSGRAAHCRDVAATRQTTYSQVPRGWRWPTLANKARERVCSQRNSTSPIGRARWRAGEGAPSSPAREEWERGGRADQECSLWNRPLHAPGRGELRQTGWGRRAASGRVGVVGVKQASVQRKIRWKRPRDCRRGEAGKVAATCHPTADNLCVGVGGGHLPPRTGLYRTAADPRPGDDRRNRRWIHR